jgi:hypothetical protein
MGQVSVWIASSIKIKENCAGDVARLVLAPGITAAPRQVPGCVDYPKAG